MHSYPEDLKEGSVELAELYKRPQIIAVDTGHTHYNELVNRDGTIYAATRSTGQIEEGPAGFSIAAVDEGVVELAFQTARKPLVMIASPADRRLVRHPSAANQVITGPFDIHALAWGAKGIENVSCRIDEGSWIGMEPIPATALWTAHCEKPRNGFQLTVKATDMSGATGSETIAVATCLEEVGCLQGNWRMAGKTYSGTGLGPNKNGRKW